MKKTKFDFLKASFFNGQGFDILSSLVASLFGFFAAIYTFKIVYSDVFLLNKKQIDDPLVIIEILIFLACAIGTLLGLRLFKKEFLPRYKNMKKNYFFESYMYTFDESTDIYLLQSKIYQSKSNLWDMISKSNFSELNKTLSDSWREQGSLIKYFYEKEDYESLARYKNADFQRIEFEKDNDYVETKNQSESAEEEIVRLNIILQKLDLDLKRIYEQRNLFQKELKKLGIDLL